jgi:hypothetical protein
MERSMRVEQLANLHCLWIGQRLGWREQLCLTSWRAHGHAVTLWAYEPLDGVPPGVVIAPADDILPRTILGGRTEPPLLSDRFRYLLLRSHDGVTWFDTDVLLLRPLDNALPYLYAWEAPDLLGAGIIRLPSRSPALRDLVKFVEKRAPVPPWWPFRKRLRQYLRGFLGRHETPERMKWGTFGPIALTAYLRRHRLLDQAQPAEVFYPIHWTQTGLYFEIPDAVTPLLSQATIGVHLWNKIIREQYDFAPPPGSWLAEMCRRYDVAISGPPASAI